MPQSVDEALAFNFNGSCRITVDRIISGLKSGRIHKEALDKTVGANWKGVSKLYNEESEQIENTNMVAMPKVGACCCCTVRREEFMWLHTLTMNWLIASERGSLTSTGYRIA